MLRFRGIFDDFSHSERWLQEKEMERAKRHAAADAAALRATPRNWQGDDADNADDYSDNAEDDEDDATISEVINGGHEHGEETEDKDENLLHLDYDSDEDGPFRVRVCDNYDHDPELKFSQDDEI